MESAISEKTLDDSPLPSPEKTLDYNLPLFPELNQPFYAESSPFIYGEFKPSMMGAGLANLGNTCFLNAVLQCFTHTVPLVQSLRSCNHETPCHRSSEGFCVLCTMREHIELSLASSGQTIAPYKLFDNLNYLSSSFRRYEQEDAHEFLQCLLDRLDSCFDMNMKDQSSSFQGDSFVKQIFGGRLRSQLRCSNCAYCSDTFEPLIDLSLEIEDVDTLPSALESFTKVEKIEETKFTCENCKEEVLVEKQFTLDKTPSVATFHLKRFKNDGSYVEKIDKHVQYPLELNLQPYTSNQDNNNVEMKYELYAVVVHIGLSSCSGHYFCFIRSSPHTWYSLDDSKVIRVREDFVLSQEAYILFYARQGSPWFSSLMENQKQHIVHDNETTSPTSVLDDMDNICTTFPPRANTFSGNLDEARDNVERISTAIPLDCFSGEGEKVRDDVNVCPQTPSPPRSPSPDDVYKEEPTEVTYVIPRGHLRLKNEVVCKTPAHKALEDLKRREAIRMIKGMPSARGMKMRACMLGSHSEGSLNRKKRKMKFSCDVGRDRSPILRCDLR